MQRKYMIKFSLQKKLFFLILACSLTFILIESVFNYYNAKNELNNQIVMRLEFRADALSKRLNDIIQGHLDFNHVFEMESELYFSSFINSENDTYDLTEIAPFLERVKNSSRLVRETRIYDVQGVRVYPKEVEDSSHDDIIGFKNSTFDRTTFLGLFKDKNNIIYSHVVFPIHHDNRIIGYVRNINDGNQILKVTQDYSQFGETGEAVIAAKGSAGDAIFQTPLRFDKGAALTTAVGSERNELPITKAINKQELTLQGVLDYRGEKVIAVTKYIDSVGWGIVAKIDEKEAFLPTEKLLITYLIVGLLVIFILVVVAYFISVIFTSPIEKLTRRIRLATGSAKIGIWEFDIVKKELIWDDQMYALYGTKKEDFSGAYDAWQKGLHADDKKRGDDEVKDALAGKKDFDTSFRVMWPDKSIHYIRAFAFVERDKTGKPLKMVGINFDITDQMEIDRAKTEFVSLASHQLRTPISSINWYAEMLLDGDAGKLKTEQHEYLSNIYKSSQRMNSLVNSLLNVSRIELGTFEVNPQTTNIFDLVTSVVNEQQKEIIRKKLKIKTNFPNHSQEIEIDQNLFRIIAQNLITNAVNYTNNNGSINISITLDKTNFILAVSDDGIGIPENQKDKIFTKLYRADNVKKIDTDGTGLGLYLTRSIVEVLEGQISFKSYVGKGSTFTVLLPKKIKAKEGSKKLTLL